MRLSKLIILITSGILSSSLAPAQTVPQFAARQDYISTYTYWVQIGDTNGDGIPDMIAADGPTVKVLFGNGDGTFRYGPISALDGRLDGSTFQVADVNGDGILDFVMAPLGSTTPNPSYLLIGYGNGDGTFSLGPVYPIGNDDLGGSTVIADFTGDGKLDIAVGSESGVWLFVGNGDGTFQAGVLSVPIPGGVGFLATADFNSDGRPDLVVAGVYYAPGNSNNGIYVAFGLGNGIFQSPVHYSQPPDVYEVAAGPVTASGTPGFAVSLIDKPYTLVYVSDGAGDFLAPRIANLNGFIALGDVNGDGYPDIINTDGQIAFGTPSGKYRVVSYPTLGGKGVAVGDLRSIGRVDIITDGGSAGNSVLLNQGNGKFEDGNWTPVTGGVQCPVSADFNRDGKPDLAISRTTGITVLFGTGSVSKPLVQGSSSVTLDTPGCPVTADFNGDGIPDLLAPTPTAVVALLGKGDGTFLAPTSTVTSAEGYLAVADFNHDGKLDFATSGNLISLGNGDGTFRSPTPIMATPPSGGFSNIAAGDINGDGWPDLVLTSSASPVYVNVTILLNNRHGGFTQVPSNFGEFTDQAFLVDLNGDGKLDLVLGSAVEGGDTIYLGDGKGKFTSSGVVLGDYGSTTVGEFNGDGIPDLAVQNNTSIIVYLGKGDGTFETGPDLGMWSQPGLPLAVRLHGPDFAGPDDLVIPDSSGGVLVLVNESH